jgi:hypothetical protein
LATAIYFGTISFQIGEYALGMREFVEPGKFGEIVDGSEPVFANKMG